MFTSFMYLFSYWANLIWTDMNHFKQKSWISTWHNAFQSAIFLQITRRISRSISTSSSLIPCSSFVLFINHSSLFVVLLTFFNSLFQKLFLLVSDCSIIFMISCLLVNWIWFCHFQTFCFVCIVGSCVDILSLPSLSNIFWSITYFCITRTLTYNFWLWNSGDKNNIHWHLRIFHI